MKVNLYVLSDWSTVTCSGPRSLFLSLLSAPLHPPPPPTINGPSFLITSWTLIDLHQFVSHQGFPEQRRLPHITHNIYVLLRQRKMATSERWKKGGENIKKEDSRKDDDKQLSL